MRIAVVALAVLGALVSVYVPLAAYQNNLSTSYPFPAAFFVVGAVLASIGAAAAVLVWRGSKVGRWLLVAATVASVAAWPWLPAAMIYLLAVVASVLSSRMAHGASGTTEGLA